VRFILRWRMVLITGPFAAGLVGIRISTGPQGEIEQSVLNVFISSTIFVLTIMLQGIIRDFNESERMPSEFASFLNSVATQVMIGATCKKFDPQPALEHVERMMLTILDFIDGRGIKYGEACEELRRAEVAVSAELDSHGAPHVPNMNTRCTEIGRLIGRLHVIRNTSFLLPGYALMDAVSAATLVLLQITIYTNINTAIASVAIYSFLFIYLNLLIRDLDDPFDYPPGFNRACYERGTDPHPPTRYLLQFGSSINFSPLTMEFGGKLKELLGKADHDSNASAIGLVTKEPRAPTKIS